MSWMSKLQSIVSLFTTETEYMAASEAHKELLWLKAFLSELGMFGFLLCIVIVKMSFTWLRTIHSTTDEAHRPKVSCHTGMAEEQGVQIGEHSHGL